LEKNIKNKEDELNVLKEKIKELEMIKYLVF